MGDKIPFTSRHVNSVLDDIVKTDKPTIIILGEKHEYNPDAFPVIAKIIEDAVAKFGAEHVTIYTEAPTELLSVIEDSPDLTDFHVLLFRDKYGLDIVGSSVTPKNRNAKGSSDKEYAEDITRISSQCVIACVGILHSTEIYKQIPETFNKHVYNVCGVDTIDVMTDIQLGVEFGVVTEENFISLRKLPIIFDDLTNNSKGGFVKSRKRTRRRKAKKTRKN